jgi:S1-C subfamily serine protease
MEKIMEEPPELPESRTMLWKKRLQRLGGWARKIAPFAATAVVTLLAVFIFNQLTPKAQLLTTNDVKDTVNQVLASATPPPAFSEGVYQIIQPSLVLIQAKSTGTDGKEQDSLGSGVIVDANGDILTSLHVVVDATTITLAFADGTHANGTVTVKQPQNDIAVLTADKLPAQIVPAVLGNPNAMHVGDEAYVVGNPFGLYSSMSAGVISGFGRSFTPPNSNQTLQNLIQIDAAVNPGNSGGPVLNRYGQVIGIAEGIVNPTGQDVFIGIGFAVPINVAGGAAGSPLD